jgi:hypothetical protein
MTADSALKTPTIDGPLVETMTGPISTAELGFTLMPFLLRALRDRKRVN